MRVLAERRKNLNPSMPETRKTLTLDQMIRIVFLALFLSGMLWYLTYQSQNLIRGPQIMLTDINTVQSERRIAISGSARNIVELSLNGREIHTDPEGNFNEMLVLENGYTIMTLSAEDRYGRSVTLSRPFVYKPEV